MKTLFIENDLVFNEEEIQTHSRLHGREFVFDKIITDAFSHTVEAFEAILESDEIYVSTAFIGPSAQVFDALSYHLIKHNVIGKKLFIFRPVERLHLWNIQSADNFHTLFKENELYCEVESNTGVEFEKVLTENLL